MRKIIITAFFLGLIAIISCQKKDTINNSDPVPTPNYFPMTIGNYWVYENYRTRDNQVELMEELDSIIIVGDTIIKDETYFVFDSYIEPQGLSHKSILRDSMGYVIDVFGKVLFTLNNPGEIFFQTIEYDNDGDTLVYRELYVDTQETQVSLPAGEFTAINLITDFIIFPNSSMPDSLKYRSTNAYFINNIGKATDFLFYASGVMDIEKKLIRYHLEEQP